MNKYKADPFTLDISLQNVCTIEFRWIKLNVKEKLKKTTNQVICKINWICLHFATAKIPLRLVANTYLMPLHNGNGLCGL